MLLLLACTPSRDDLSTLLAVNADVLEGVHVGLEALETRLDRHSQGDGRYSYEGTLGPGLGWEEGSVTVGGEALIDQDGGRQDFGLTVVYDEVHSGGLILDGELAWEMLVLTEDGRLDLDYSLVGTLLVDEAWEAVLDVQRDVDPTEDGFDETWTGNINGTEVSGL